VPPGAMRTELKRVDCVKEDKDGNLSIVKRSIVPADKTDNLVTSLVHGVYPLLSTVAVNSDSVENSRGLTQLTAYSVSIRKEDLTRLRRISNDRLMDIAESFDDLFMAYETLNAAEVESETTTVAVGLYYFEELDRNAKYEW